MHFKTEVITENRPLKENEIAYDIQDGVDRLREFIKKTIQFTKEYKKLTKKMNGSDEKKQKKENFKFSKTYLLTPFKNSLNESFFKNSELSYLSDDEIHTYILGIFISANSQEPNIKNNIDKIYAKALQEICNRSMNNRMLTHSIKEGK